MRERFAADFGKRGASGSAGQNGGTGERSSKASEGVEIRLASFRSDEVTGDENNVGLKLLTDGAAESFGAISIGTIADDETSAFTRQERDGGGTKSAGRTGENDDAAL